MTPDTPADAIVAALQAGDAATAERLCRGRLREDPASTDLQVLLALSLWRLDRHAESVDVYRTLAHAHPGDPMHWRNYATVLRQAGELAAAAEASAVAIRLAPEDVEWLEWHALLEQDLDQPGDARDTLLRAFGKAPDSPAIRIHAALACLACRDARAENLLRPWRTWLPLDDALTSELAEALKEQGDVAAAVELLEDLSRRLPGDWRIRLRLAILYERVNRLEEAGTLLEAAAAEIAPDDADAASEIAHQRAQLASRRGEYAAARTLLEAAGPRAAGDFAHGFMLAAACDKAGDPAAAMQALAAAHAQQVAELAHVVPHLLEPGAEILPRVEARVSADDYRAWPALRAPEVLQSPVFVVGFPRSGTTLLEQMLDAHPRMQSMDERPFFNLLAGQLENSTGLKVPDDLGKLDQRDCDELRKGYLISACGKVHRSWDTRLVDKNPLNMLWLPMIHRMFPHAQFILAVRHPCDVIMSCYLQNFRSAVLAVASRSLERLARAYVAAMETWLYHVEVFKPDVFVSRYEHLVIDTPEQTRRIAAFLGLDDPASMLAFDARARAKGFIATPSYTQVIEPVNRKGVGRWRRYREHFTSALPILEPMLEYWGYEVGAAVRAAER